MSRLPRDIDPLSRRIAYFRLGFVRGFGLGRKPTRLQALALDNAATLTAKVEQAALDPNTTANDLVRLDNAARRARAEMKAALQGRDPGALGYDFLADEAVA